MKSFRNQKFLYSAERILGLVFERTAMSEPEPQVFLNAVERNWLKQVVLAFNQLCNAMLGGWADETISSRAYRQRHKPHWGAINRALDRIFFWQNAHCRGAYNNELQRTSSPPAHRPSSK